MTNVVLLKRKAVTRRDLKDNSAAKDGLSLIRAFTRIKLKSDREAVIALAKKLARKK